MSAHGAIDIIAMKNGEVFFFDVKAGAEGSASATTEQIATGVVILRAKADGSFIVEEPKLRKYPGCVVCGKIFEIHKRRNRVYCSTACSMNAKNARYGVGQKTYNDGSPVPPPICVECERPIDLTRRPGGRLYCSDACEGKVRYRKRLEKVEKKSLDLGAT